MANPSLKTGVDRPVCGPGNERSHLSLDDYKMILENHEKHLIFQKCLNCNLSCFSFLIPEASRSAFGLTYSWSSEFYGSIVNIQHEKCQIWMMYGIKMEEGENYGINYFHNFGVFNHSSHFFKLRNKQKMSIQFFWLWVFIFKIYKSPISRYLFMLDM